MRRIGVLAFTALAACAAQSDNEPIKNTHDACSPLALVSSTATTQLQLDGLEAGQALWRDRGVPALGLRAGATLEVIFEEAAGPFHGLYDDEQGVIYINTDILDPKTLAIVIAHETGHAFGLPHVPRSERISVMNPGNLDTPPTAADQAEIVARWGACN